MVEKFRRKDAKKGNFSEQMEFRKRSKIKNGVNVFIKSRYTVFEALHKKKTKDRNTNLALL